MPTFLKGVQKSFLGSFTVAKLPTAAMGAAPGDTAYATDGQKPGGTGVQVFRDASTWIAFDTGLPVAAAGGSTLAISGAPSNASTGDNPTFSPTISGGTAPYTLSLLSGTLPPGRAVNSSARTVTGAYTTAGSYSYVLRATDAVGATADLPVTLSVVAAAVTPTYLRSVSAPPSMVLGTAKLVSAYSGPAVRVQRISDDVEQDVGFGSKFLDMASAAAFRGSSELGVKTFYDQSGNGFNEAQATKSDQPGLFAKSYGDTPVVSFDSKTITSVVSKRMSAAAGPALVQNAFTIFALLAPNVSLKGSMIFAAGTTDNQVALYTRMDSANVGNVGLLGNVGSTASNSGLIPPMQPCVIALRGGSDRQIRLNGVKQTVSGTAPAATAMTGLDLGRVFASFSAGSFDAAYDLMALVAYPAALSDADCASVEADLMQQVSVQTGQAVKLIFDGDSRTEGFGATKNEGWTRKLVRQLSVPVYATNMGVGGQTLNTMGARVAARVAAQYDASRAKNIVVMGGPAINDFSANRTAAQAQADFITYANGIHANQLLIAATVPPHNAHNSTQIAARNDYNTWLRANWQTYAEGFVDLAAVPGLDAYNTTNFADSVHLNDAGHDLFVSAFKPEVERLIAA